MTRATLALLALLGAAAAPAASAADQLSAGEIAADCADLAADPQLRAARWAVPALMNRDFHGRALSEPLDQAIRLLRAGERDAGRALLDQLGEPSMRGKPWAERRVIWAARMMRNAAFRCDGDAALPPGPDASTLLACVREQRARKNPMPGAVCGCEGMNDLLGFPEEAAAPAVAVQPAKQGRGRRPEQRHG